MSTYDLIIHARETIIPLNEMHFSTKNKNALEQLLKEFKHVDALQKHQLPVDNKLLLFGRTGCGKTATAKAIAKSLDKKLIILDLSGIVSSKLGETAKNIKAVFQKTIKEEAVLFMDEFDYLGKLRDADLSDSGEMKRLVNAIIQLIDYLPNSTLLIAATNHAHMIDSALLRRFQLKLKYELPDVEQLNNYYDAILMQYPSAYRNIERVYSISYAEAKDVLFREIKNQIIAEEEQKEDLINKN